MAGEPVIRGARPDDWPAVEALLRACALPVDGAAQHLADFVVAESAGRLVAVAGLEAHGADALLRSVAVSSEARSAGLGRTVVDAVEALARERGVQRLHLLTTTAAGYFSRRGFRRRERAAAPAPLRASAEFRGACPASATFMTLSLAAATPRLRPATPDDAAACAAIYRPIVLETGISFEWEPPSVEDFRARIEKISAKYPWLVALDDRGEVAGFAHANTHRDAPSYQWSVNTSIFIREDSRGLGLGLTLYAGLHRQLVELGYLRAFAGVALPNAGSVALHEATGYERLGVYEKVGFKQGRWRDVAWFQKALQALPDDPLPPKTPVMAPDEGGRSPGAAVPG
ncbi:MAG TPA: arsenic resistance N-acetyltransferase ArsN2 [Burkholderiaceae bacterium]